MSDERNDYMMLHPYCAVCHWPADRHGRWMELHHIVGGAGRKDLPENWISLCCRCHHAVHDRLPEYGELPKGAILSAKIEADGSVDLEKLASLKRRKNLPYEPEKIPAKFLADRRKKGGSPWP
jgi:hypothetical protein